MATTRKLTEPQRKMLQNVSDGRTSAEPKGRHWTRQSLWGHGLISHSGDLLRIWHVTDKGRDALKTGRYTPSA